jgi:hypothetical protein
MEQMVCQQSANASLTTATNRQNKQLSRPGYLTQANSNIAHMQIHHHDLMSSVGIKTGTKAGIS